MNFRTKSIAVGASVWLIAAMGIAGCTKDAAQLFESAVKRDERGDKNGAIIELKSAIQQDPNNGAMRFMLGRLFNETFDGASAEKELRKAKELGAIEGGQVSVELALALKAQGKLKELLSEVQPSVAFSPLSQATVHALRGRAHLTLGRLLEARQSLDAGARVLKEAPQVVILDATLKGGERRFDEALAAVEAMLVANPGSFEGWRLKAHLLSAQGKDEETLAVYAKILELNPIYMGALVYRSALLMKLGRLDEAEKDVQLLARTYKLHPQTHVQRAQLLLARGRPRDALDALQLALKAQPPPPRAMLLAGIVHATLGSLQQAESQLNSFVLQNPREPVGIYALAAVYIQMNKANRALDLIAPLLRSDAPSQTALLAAGDAYAALGNISKALGWYEKAVAADPKDPEGRIRHAMTRLQAGDLDGGIADLASALNLTQHVSMADEVLVLAQIKRGELDKAMATANTMLEKSPNSPVSNNMVGAVWLAKRENGKALAAFEAALKQQPSFFPAARNLAHMDLAQGNTLTAKKRLEDVIAQDPQNVLGYLELAKLGPQLKATPAEIESWLKRATSADTQSVDAVLALAYHHLRTGEPKKALEVTDTALTRMPADERLATVAARAQSEAGERNRAIMTLGKLINDKPRSIPALLQLAAVQMGGGSLREAGATLRKAISVEPTHIGAQLMLAETEMRLNNVGEAQKIAVELKKQHARSAAGWVLEGDILTREKRYASAAKAYEQALRVQKSKDAIGKLYGVLAMDGREVEGAQRLESWLQDQPDDVGTRLHLAQIYRNAERHKDAILHYEHVLEKQPNDVIALNNISWSYKAIGDKRAVAVAERAYKLAPHSAAIVSTLGWMLFSHVDRDRGLMLLKQAVSMEPKSAMIRYHHARALIESGDKRGGRRELERLLVEFPGFPEGIAVRRLLSDVTG